MHAWESQRVHRGGQREAEDARIAGHVDARDEPARSRRNCRRWWRRWVCSVMVLCWGGRLGLRMGGGHKPRRLVGGGSREAAERGAGAAIGRSPERSWAKRIGAMRPQMHPRFCRCRQMLVVGPANEEIATSWLIASKQTCFACSDYCRPGGYSGAVTPSLGTAQGRQGSAVLIGMLSHVADSHLLLSRYPGARGLRMSSSSLALLCRRVGLSGVKNGVVSAGAALASTVPAPSCGCAAPGRRSGAPASAFSVGMPKVCHRIRNRKRRHRHRCTRGLCVSQL